MRKYVVKLPRGIEVDIFNLPEDFEEQIREELGIQITIRSND